MNEGEEMLGLVPVPRHCACVRNGLLAFMLASVCGIAFLQGVVLCRCLGIAHGSEMVRWRSCRPVFVAVPSVLGPGDSAAVLRMIGNGLLAFMLASVFGIAFLQGPVPGQRWFVHAPVGQCLVTLRSFTEPWPSHAPFCVRVWRLSWVPWDIPAAQM